VQALVYGVRVDEVALADRARDEGVHLVQCKGLNSMHFFMIVKSGVVDST
jgi:hypothetical protein